MSQSEKEEEKCTELIALQQLNGPEDPEPHSSASSKLNSAGVLERCKAYLYSHWQCLEIATLAVVVVIVLVLLLLPIILYHLPQPQNESNNTSGNQSNSSNVPSHIMCYSQAAQTDIVNTCSVYTGAACQNHLLTLQGCVLDRHSRSYAYVSATDQEEKERQAVQILNGLTTLGATPECRAVAEPFICLYLFGLCDSSGMVYAPSYEDCVLISTDLCASEWAMANRFLPLLGLPSLPECRSFQSTASAISGSGSGSGRGKHNETSDQPPTTARLDNCSTLQCSEDFSCSVVRNGSLCLPVCGSWEQLPHGTVVAVDVVIVLSAVIGVIASIAVVVISCIRWNRMFTFPSVFIVYQTITVMVIGVFVLITYTDRTSLYCPSEHLIDIETMRLVGPTPFCTLSGIVFYYGLFQLIVWWFCHEVSLFWTIRFPMHAKTFETSRRVKYVHITMVVMGLVLPTLPVIVTFTTGDPSGFGMTRFPPILCTGLQKDSTFYSLVLPINICMIIGIPLLIIIFWTIHKQQGLFRMKLSKQPFKIGTAERKVLIIFCYYVLLFVITLTTFTNFTRTFTDLGTKLAEYWQCELSGVDSENTCDEMKASFYAPGLTALSSISYILLGLLPAVNLVFAVNINELRQKFRTLCSRITKLYSIEEPSTSSSAGTALTLRRE